MNGELRLWSCDAAAGAVGDCFHRSACASDGHGRCGLDRPHRRCHFWAAPGISRHVVHRLSARPPLTAAAMAAYAGVMGTKTWIGPSGTTTTPTSGTFATAANWFGGVAPVANDDLVFGGTTGAAYTVTVGASPGIAFDSITLNSTGGLATLAVGTFTLLVNGSGGGATDAVTVAANNAITIAGGTITTGASGGIATRVPSQHRAPASQARSRAVRSTIAAYST